MRSKTKPIKPKKFSRSRVIGRSLPHEPKPGNWKIGVQISARYINLFFGRAALLIMEKGNSQLIS